MSEILNMDEDANADNDSSAKRLEACVPITRREIPNLLESQISKFNLETIHSRELMKFDPTLALVKLTTLNGRRVIAADFGGDKGVTKLFVVKDGRLTIDSEYEDYVHGDFGNGYLSSLEKTAKFASENNIPVGISWGGPMDGTKPLGHPKAQMFLDELRDKYDNDFKNVLPTMKTCVNDGPAGVISAVIESMRSYYTSTVLFPINGGGLGMSVLSNGMIYSTEAGHVEADKSLNYYDQHEPCGVFDADYVCLERLGANKVGIEAQWKKITNEEIGAREIEDRYRSGDKLAADLYDHSALVVAHMIKGVAKAYDIGLDDSNTIIVGHGGAFKFPNYGERIRQILNKSINSKVKLMMTKDYIKGDSNACLEGAAIAALVSG